MDDHVPGPLLAPGSESARKAQPCLGALPLGLAGADPAGADQQDRDRDRPVDEELGAAELGHRGSLALHDTRKGITRVTNQWTN